MTQFKGETDEELFENNIDDAILQQTIEHSRDIIHSYFRDNQYALVQHHIDSYNDFMETGIKQIIQENNPIKIRKNFNEDTQDYDVEIDVYIGGNNGDKLYFGKPTVYDGDESHVLFPNEARLRSITYATNVHFDVDVHFSRHNVFINDPDDDSKTIIGNEDKSLSFSKILLGRFPIMCHSNLCLLRDMPKGVINEMGECPDDNGGYFIIDGKEKLVIPQEKFGDNMMYIKKNSTDDKNAYSCIMRTVSENASKPERTFKIHIVNPDNKYSNKQIVVDVPNVRTPVPLFILMRALGIESDKQIIQTCLLNIDKYKDLVETFRPSIHDAYTIFTQPEAIRYIANLTKYKSNAYAHTILRNFLLPNVGEDNYKTKAYMIGHMVFELLQVYHGVKQPTDRDSFKFKRLELTGELLYSLFKEYYLEQKKNIFLRIEKEIYYKHNNLKETNGAGESSSDVEKQVIDSLEDDINLDGEIFTQMFSDNVDEFFKDKIVEKGFSRAMKGNWGGSPHTKRQGVVQDLNRLSFNSALSQLRKINLPLDSSAKVIGPRLLHTTQYGIIDPIDTPDGGDIGLHKHLAITCHISRGIDSGELVTFLQNNIPFLSFENENPAFVEEMPKLFINGRWIGIVSEPFNFVSKVKQLRRTGCLPWSVSVAFHISANKVELFCDGGRLASPYFYIDRDENQKPIASVHSKTFKPKFETKDYTWNNLVYGLNKISDDLNVGKELYSPKKYFGLTNELGKDEAVPQKYIDNRGIIDIIDTNEKEDALVATVASELNKPHNKYTHLEIHPSLNFGVMGNQIIFLENNPATRNGFSCGQSKQAVSLYHTNYHQRFDKMGVVLNYGQKPLIRTQYLKYIQEERHPYGENVIVAIMSYSGYNVEDAILINQGAVDRGLFRTTYMYTVESKEESIEVPDATKDSIITQIGDEIQFKNKKKWLGYDYSHLDERGVIRENTPVGEKVVLIGKVVKDEDEHGEAVLRDSSIFSKKGGIGVVDKTYLSNDDEGFRVAKVRIREERIPAIGDKMASRAGQKGTIGLVIPHEDMPFTRGGIVPDIIINPHAIPSRMTIGQLVEMLFGKVCLNLGGMGDCTPFVNQGPKDKIYGDILETYDIHHSGTEMLHNGFTGEQLESNIYIGPTYYMRLKHMVKDKINHRARGPRQQLTRQTVQGRANDGGLRVGEMERDGIIAHGASAFLRESFLVRGDEYYMCICNQTGTIAVYNAEKSQFYSLFADGYLKYNDVSNIEDMTIRSMTKHGRSFSFVKIPYTLKLLIQELQAMNVQMRLITEDNVDKLEKLSFSRNFADLLKIEKPSDYELLNIPSKLKAELTDAKEAKTKSRYVNKQNVNVGDEDESNNESSHIFENHMENNDDGSIESEVWRPDTNSNDGEMQMNVQSGSPEYAPMYSSNINMNDNNSSNNNSDNNSVNNSVVNNSVVNNSNTFNDNINSNNDEAIESERLEVDPIVETKTMASLREEMDAVNNTNLIEPVNTDTPSQLEISDINSISNETDTGTKQIKNLDI